MFTESDKNYIKSKSQFLQKCETEGIKITENLLSMMARQIFYYTIKRNFQTEAYEPTSDEEYEEAEDWTQAQIIDFLKTETECDERLVKYIDDNFNLYDKQINDLREKFHNNMKWGTELEFGGRGDFLSMSNYGSIIQDEKHDGSVSGSGREYNLVPLDYYFLRNPAAKKNLENFMKDAVNKTNCTDAACAGEHIHYSYDGICSEHGADIQNAINEMCLKISNYTTAFTEMPHNIKYFNDQKDLADKERDLIMQYAKYEELQRDVKIYDAFRWLYSISNRTGHENYGLRRDVTRGYTCHRTIELRAWRTTLDYRSVLARVTVGWYWLTWMIEKAELNKLGFVDWHREDIWQYTRENEYLADMYKYLAFHNNNKHQVGLDEQELILKLNVTKAFASAVKARSRMFAKQLKINSPEEQAKKLFNKIA